MEIIGDDAILTSGKRFYASRGILGVSDEDGEISVTYGYDGGIKAEDFTPNERREIAEYCIRLWQRWGGP